MTQSGFLLSRLRVVGPGVDVAEIQFSVGLNVISGPSDTGKTYILQCIDFALGAKDPPKAIPEAEGYDRVLLTIQTYGQWEKHTIERSLLSGKVIVYPGEADPDAPPTSGTKLKWKHDAKKDDNLSSFLLRLCDLSGRKLRKNKYGETKALSFRDLTRLSLIDEETVISERSPIHSGRSVSRTAESSLFRLLLTGVDDSSLVAAEDPKLVKIRRAGRAEVLEDLAVEIRSELEDLGLDIDHAGIMDRLGQLDGDLDALSRRLQGEQSQMHEVESARRSAWREARKLESRLAVLSELSVRFDLLESHYTSDQARLESIGEAAGRLGELRRERCPLCGATAEHQDYEHEHLDLSPAEVEEACHAEKTKTAFLQSDLASTIENTAAVIGALRDEFTQKTTEIQKFDEELKASLAPRVHEALERFHEIQADRDLLMRARGLYERLDSLEKLAEQATLPEEKAEELPSAAVDAQEVEKFSTRVQEVLESWSFPELRRVTFNEKDEDVVISGRRRSSHGKGVRAVTHASFVLGLLRYCELEPCPHPGFVAIDSPLVVYREPDGDEQMPTELKDAFYRGTAKLFRTRQVLIVENEDPPEDFSAANVVRFTKSEEGRRGFIPTA